VADVVADDAAADEVWLGYDGGVIRFAEISALLLYQPVWDRRLRQHWGAVPAGVQTVVLLTDGRVLPARFALADLHARWVAWQRRSALGDDRPDPSPMEEA
jgi:hypothetical protein